VAHAPDGVVLFRRGCYGRTAWLEAETYKFVFVPEGRYGVEVCDQDVGVAPGQFVLLNPHDRHRHLGLSGTKLLVEVRPEAMSEAAAALGRLRPPRFRQLRSSDGLLRTWARDWAADAEDGRDLDPAEIVVGLALRLIELQHGPPSFRASAAVTRAVKLINEQYAQRLTIDVLAAAACMERFAFAHAFRRETGLAPHAYLRERRLAAAAAALDGNKPIIEVASTLVSAPSAASTVHFAPASGSRRRATGSSASRGSAAHPDARNAQIRRHRSRSVRPMPTPRCFLVFALAPEGMPAAEANRLLNEYVGDHSHGLPVYHDHFARKPHGGVAVVFPRDEAERARLDEAGPLAGWQIRISPLVFSLTPVGFTAQTSFTLEQYGRTTLAKLIAEEKPSKRYWWQRRVNALAEGPRTSSSQGRTGSSVAIRLPAGLLKIVRCLIS
jgi:AraC family transcriptional regulator